MPHFRSTRWRTALSFTIATAAILVGLSFFSLSQVRNSNVEQQRERLTTAARLLAEDLGLRAALDGSRWQVGDTAPDRLVASWSELLDARVTLLRADGVVLADSQLDPHSIDNQIDQPEVRQALASSAGFVNLPSGSPGSGMRIAVVVAPPAADPASADATQTQEAIGIVRLTVPGQQLDARNSPLRLTILLATLVALAASAAIAYFLAWLSARPFRQLIRMAAGMARGEPGAPIEAGSADEVGQLVRLFNRVRDRLQAQVASVSRERERLTSVLDNLVDGVFILDSEGRVRHCNPVGARMVGASWREESSRHDIKHDNKINSDEKIDNDEAVNNDGATSPLPPFTRLPNFAQGSSGIAHGQYLAQVVRDHRIVETWQACRDDGMQAESILRRGHRTIRVIALPFLAGGDDGFIVLLQDMTELHRLERVRRDFVSNISHELRTPLASLRALTETLRDGALDDPDAAPRFLDRIETEVDSLAQMVRELLELSRIESGQVPFRFRPVPVSEVVLTPVERLQPLAARRQISLIVDLSPRLPRVYADAERVHQVITNLVHNAVEYSPSNATIKISASGQTDGRQVTVSVTDKGVGIPVQDQDRIFERFYKTDRARSGSGTGLGLAIAKHIVQAHGGRIWVDSVENRGSAFSFTLLFAQNGS